MWFIVSNLLSVMFMYTYQCTHTQWHTHTHTLSLSLSLSFSLFFLWQINGKSERIGERGREREGGKERESGRCACVPTFFSPFQIALIFSHLTCCEHSNNIIKVSIINNRPHLPRVPMAEPRKKRARRESGYYLSLLNRKPPAKRWVIFHQIFWDTWAYCFVCCLTSQQHIWCISGTDPLKQFDMMMMMY